MRIHRMAAGLGIVLGVLSTTLVGCSGFASTKTSNGQLYQSGDGRYDGYFATVHQEQVASGRWADESRSSRKPIVTALNLRPGASNSTILSAMRDKQGATSLAAAVEQTTSAELERARRLTAAASKLDELQKRGEELKKQAAEDKRNLGADKADEKKAAKKEEVRREMSAAVDAVESMADDARKGAKEAEELATKLRAAWGKADDGKSGNGNGDDKKKPEPVAKKATPKNDAPAKKPKPEPTTSEDKPTKPAPAQKAPDEVFNP